MFYFLDVSDISKGQYEDAWKAHLNLMVDYTAEVKLPHYILNINNNLHKQYKPV